MKCGNAFQKMEQNCQLLISFTNAACDKTFGEIRKSLESFYEETVQKCLLDFETNQKSLQVLEAKVAQSLHTFSSSIPPLQESLSFLERKVEILEASRTHQVRENEFLRSNVETLSTNVQLLMDKFALFESKQICVSSSIHPGSTGADQRSTTISMTPQVIPLLSVAQPKPPPKASLGGVNVVMGERLRVSNPGGSSSSINQTPFLTPLMLTSASIGLPTKFSGKNSDWLAFKTQWEMWVQTMSMGDGSDDRLVFANLAKVLDDGEAANLLRMRTENPALSYATL